MSSWIVDAARRQAGKQLAASVAVLAILVALVVGQWDYLREYFRGAHPVSAQELISGSATTQGWIRVTADKLHTTGLQVITVRKKHGVERSRSVSTEYFVAEIGERLLLVKGVPDQSALLEGTLVPIDTEAMSRLLDTPERRASVGPRFLPQAMDTHDYAGNADVALPLGGLVALVALLWGALGAWRVRNPLAHPAVKPLVASKSLQAASDAIDGDLAARRALKLGDTILTRGYVVTQSLTKFDVKPTTQLLWAYKQVTQKKFYYVIPAGKTYAACLNFEQGTVVVNGKEALVDQALAFLMQHAPWTVYGHSPELAAAYKNKRQREQLKAHVQNAIDKARETTGAASST